MPKLRRALDLSARTLTRPRPVRAGDRVRVNGGGWVPDRIGTVRGVHLDRVSVQPDDAPDLRLWEPAWHLTYLGRLAGGPCMGPDGVVRAEPLP